MTVTSKHNAIMRIKYRKLSVVFERCSTRSVYYPKLYSRFRLLRVIRGMSGLTITPCVWGWDASQEHKIKDIASGRDHIEAQLEDADRLMRAVYGILENGLWNPDDPQSGYAEYPDTDSDEFMISFGPIRSLIREVEAYRKTRRQ